MTWHGMGVRASKVLAGGREGWTFYVDNDTGDVFDLSRWRAPIRVGGPGADFAINDWTLYGVSVDRTQVWSYGGEPMRWHEQARPPARVTSIFGGGGLLLCYLENGRMVIGAEGHPWREISDRPALWLGVQSGMPYNHPNVVYALRDDRSVEEWVPDDWDPATGRGHWQTVRPNGTTRRIVVGGALVGDPTRRHWDGGGPGGYLWAADTTGRDKIGSPTGNVHVRREGVWHQVGGPGALFAANKSYLYGLTPDRQAVFAYTGTPHRWEALGGIPGGIVNLFAGGWMALYAVALADRQVYRYDG